MTRASDRTLRRNAAAARYQISPHMPAWAYPLHWIPPEGIPRTVTALDINAPIGEDRAVLYFGKAS